MKDVGKAEFARSYDVSCHVFGRLEKSRELNSSRRPKRFSLRGITFNQWTAVLDAQGVSIW